MSSAIVDQEVNYHAAFNLPAVLTTVGAARWDELQGCFAALVKDTKFPVRRTLAYSLHELAAILGPALTEQSLLPALDTFLRDLDEVRYGVLKNFALIMRAITPAKRIAYLEVIWMVQVRTQARQEVRDAFGGSCSLASCRALSLSASPLRVSRSKTRIGVGVCCGRSSWVRSPICSTPSTR